MKETVKWYEKLERQRQEFGYSRQDVVRHVSHDFPENARFTIKTLFSWEKGRTKPNMHQAMALAQLYETTMLDLFGDGAWQKNTPWQVPADLEDGLNEEGKEKLREYRALLLESPRYRAQPALRVCRTLPVYLQAASAGTGQMLDDEAHELVDVDDSVPAAAEFGVRLAGDSMMPRFSDRQIVWARRQEVADSGDIVLCYLDGQSYCKMFEDKGDGIQLISLNPDYAPIPVGPESDFRIFGRVLG